MLNPSGTSIFNWQIDQEKGALLLPTREAFDSLATTTNVSGITGVREVKFVIANIDTNQPILYFMNSKENSLHYDFFRNTLNYYQSYPYERGGIQFTAESYFKKDRKHLVGSIVAYDNYNNLQTKGLYTIEFWPTDPMSASLIEQAYLAATAATPFLPTVLAYHPVGNTQELELSSYIDKFSEKNIRTIETNQLFTDLESAVLNSGEAYGRLKIVNPSDPSPSIDTIAIYTFIPNTLSHVGGIITEQPQTPLSHINLKAKQNNTPNAYIKNIRTDSKFSPLINQWVHYLVNDNGIQIEVATEAEVLQWLENSLPTEITIPSGDLSLTTAMPLTELGYDNWKQVGVKAANVAELGKILAEGVAPQGYALPFAFYDQFMQIPRCNNHLTKLCSGNNTVTLYQQIEQTLANNSFNQDPLIRRQFLEQLRSLIEKADVPQHLIDQIETVRLFWEPSGEPFKQKLRVRSSTNNEDLKDFNGAGLYDSFTHKPNEGKLINSIKQVWASLWNERAFEERRLHKIDHLKTYMGVLIHPNYGDEQANGVAVTKNIYNPDWEGYYINVQHGEISITNPKPITTDTGVINPIPDEFITTRLPISASNLDWETLFIRHTNVTTIYDKPVMNKNVLTDIEIIDLRNNLQIIHNHFKTIYLGDSQFAMDIEFKITKTTDGSRGKLAIKQARPWID